MNDDLRITNESGFPLQIAMEHQVKATTDQHGWSVRYTEHSWINRSDNQSGFIDLVLQDRFGTIFLVVECKRVRDAVWLFLRSDGTNQKRSHSQSFVSYFVNNKQKNFNWNNISVDPPTVEALFCAIRGQSTNDNKRNLLERIGGELISATEALAFEEKDFRPSGDTLRFYFNIIITTADLKVAKFLPEDISNGVLNSAVFEDVPFIRFRKQMSTRETHLSQHDYHQRYNLSSSKENTVFIVRADAIVEFLRQFEIPKNTIYQLKSG